MRIRFLSDQIYETEGPGKGPMFAKGLVLAEDDVVKALQLKKEPTPEWVEGFLNRWLQRGVAVDHDAVPDDPVTEPAPEDAPVKKLDLATLTRVELDELAAKRGVDISEAKNKGDVIAALELAEELGEND